MLLAAALVLVLLPFPQDTPVDPLDRLRAVYFHHDAPVHCAAVPHGSTVLVSLDRGGTLTGWECRTGRRLYARPAVRAAELPQRLVCSPDGRYAALTSALFSTEVVRVYAVDTGEEIRRFDRCFSPVFSPDGGILAGRDGPRIRRWSLRSGAELPGLPAAKENLRWVAYAPDSKRIAASVRGTWELAVWDLESRTLGYRERKSLGATEVTGLAFSPDGQDLTVGTPWGVDVGEGQPFEAGLPGGLPLSYAPGGRVLIAGQRGKHLRVWNAASKTFLFAESLAFESGESLGVSEDADAVLRIEGTGIYLESVFAASKPAHPTPPISCVGYDAGGNLLTADTEG